MVEPMHFCDAAHWYMQELTSRLVAKTGVASDRFHLGKIIFECLQDDPDFLMQIDAGTGQTETNGEALKRIVKCAIGFKQAGIGVGDVVALMAPNHLELGIAIYASLFTGAIFLPVDWTLKIEELESNFNINLPKMVLCQSDRAADVQLALNSIQLDSKVITFDKGSDAKSFAEFLDQSSDEGEEMAFRPTDFDPESTISINIPTSGSTGTSKSASVTHKNFAFTTPYFWSFSTNFPTPTRMAVILSPLQWLSALIIYIQSPIMKYTRVQSSLPMTTEHVYEIFNKYRPTFFIMSPTMMTTLIKPGNREKCDFSCFEHIVLGGSTVHKELISQIKVLMPNCSVGIGYGMSEVTTSVFQTFNAPLGSAGKPMRSFQYRLVDVDTGAIIDKPNVSGELWLKGPAVFKYYYNNPEETKKTFSEDGSWFKTGDLHYFDENFNYYFVERIKFLLKYKNHQISTSELENVILRHPGVLDVAVTAVADREHGDLAVACVVPDPANPPTAQAIKDLVKESLADSKQLRGGVVFLPKLPTTTSTKIHRRKLQEMVHTMKRE